MYIWVEILNFCPNSSPITKIKKLVYPNANWKNNRQTLIQQKKNYRKTKNYKIKNKYGLKT